MVNVSRRTSSTLAVVLLGAALVTTACTSQSAAEDEPTAGGEVWPASSDAVVLVRQGTELAVTDGSTVTPLGIDVPAGTSVAVSELGPGHLALLAEGDSAILWVLDLDDGATVHRACVDCRGLASVGDELVTVLGDSTLLRFDPELATSATAPLSGLPPVPVGEELIDGSWTPDYRVLGEMEDSVLVGRLDYRGVTRGGPTLVSRHDLDGAGVDEVAVTGRSSVAVPGAAGDDVVVAGTYSSGACSSGAELQNLAGEPLRTEDGEVIEDWSWAGDSVLAVTYRNEMTDSGACDYQALAVHELTPAGAESAVVDSPGLTRLRVLGACNTVVALREVAGDLPRLVAVSGSDQRDLGQYDDVLWSAPASAACPHLDDVVTALGNA